MGGGGGSLGMGKVQEQYQYENVSQSIHLSILFIKWHRLFRSLDTSQKKI
jgi:hypothetical protein